MTMLIGAFHDERERQEAEAAAARRLKMSAFWSNLHARKITAEAQQSDQAHCSNNTVADPTLSPSPRPMENPMNYEHDALVARARADGVAESRARLSAITESDEGKRTPTTANYFAFQTTFSPAEARAAMATLPAEDASVRATEAAKAGWSKAAARINARQEAPSFSASVAVSPSRRGS